MCTGCTAGQGRTGWYREEVYTGQGSLGGTGQGRRVYTGSLDPVLHPGYTALLRAIRLTPSTSAGRHPDRPAG